MSDPASSHFLPTFLRRLADPSIKTVMICGCGGGFDFVHGMLLYPELKRLGKKVVIGSYSFGNPYRIGGESPVVFEESGVVAKRVHAGSEPDPYYGPEVHVCGFLDAAFPESGPHSVYAYYARAFSVPMLKRLYDQFVREHEVDAVVIIDGGSDSLMVGDEEGLGDPIEDAVSLAAVAALDERLTKILIVVGLGTDRFNHVSDAASLRAIAELTKVGGFLGAVSVEPSNPGNRFYRECLDHIYRGQGFRSFLSGTIAAAIEGWYGRDEVPPTLGRRASPGGFYLWPLMAVLWGFDVGQVAARSMIARWIADCTTPSDCVATFLAARYSLGEKVRGVENIPRHEEMRG